VTPAPAGDGGSDPDLDVSREAFAERVEPALDAGPVVTHVTAPLPDADPLAAYAALIGRTADAPEPSHPFLLESAEKVASSDPDGAFAPESTGGHARFSFLGYDSDAAVGVGPDGPEVERLRDSTAAALVDPDPDAGDVLDVLRSALPDVERVGFPDGDRQQLAGGFVGYLAYDAVYDLHLREVGVERPDSSVPDAEFVLTTRTVAFDHAADEARLVLTPVLGPGEDPGAVYDDLAAEAERVAGVLAEATAPETGGFRRSADEAAPRDVYEEAVRAGKEHVRDGDVYQVVLSRTRELEGELDTLGLYAALREINPSPYMYLLGFGERSVVGASPETLVSVSGGEVVGNPIAGTSPRGNSPVEDRRLAGELLADEKERAEHTMLVDLARNDIRRVAEPGSVQVSEFMNVLKYSHVQHIESTVVGRLADGYDAFDATRATFPAGTLSGAPKVRAMEIIDALEATPRGIYGGGVGYFSWTGDADVAIVIRTATVEHGVDVGGDAAAGPGAGDRITVRAGAGIVADSDPAAEYEETEQKMDGVVAAIDRIEEREAAAAGGVEQGGDAEATGDAEAETGVGAER